MGSGRRGRATATAIAALGVVFQGAGASMDCLQKLCCVNRFVWCCFHRWLWFRVSRYRARFCIKLLRI